MKPKTLLLFVFIFSLNISSYAQIDTVLSRYKQRLFKTAHAADVSLLTKRLNEDGYWPDIDYHDESRSDWQLMKHLQRLQELSVAWSDPSSPYFHKSKLKQAIDRALNYWLYHRFYNSNWWCNEIGVPQYMRNIIILLRPYLNKYQHIRAFEELDQYRINGTGTNLIWSAKLGFYYGALTKDTLLMRHCIDTILHEIRINTGEGIQPDYSFHMHGNRLQIFSYGTPYLREIIKLALVCRGTIWAFPESKTELLTDFILKGWQWMSRGINTVPGTIDRGISHRGALHAADIRNLIPDLIKLTPNRSTGLQELLNRQNGEGKPLTGFRYFPYSDFAAYQSKNFSFFLKTVSTRTLPSESINGENLKGHLLNTGDAYLIHDGKEYFNLMPVWNWDKIPGITAFKGADRIVRKPFTGSVSDGKSGLTAMDYVMEGKDTTQGMRAHKIWACHNGYVICLIAGLTSGSMTGNIYTVLDQCRLEGPVIENDIHHKIKEGDHLLKNVKWIYHHGFAYIPLKPSVIQLYTGPAQGTWKSINSSGSDRHVSDSIFMPVLINGKNLINVSTGYVLTHLPDTMEMKKLIKHLPWEVLRNDTICQAVQFDDGTLMAAFFKSSTLEIGANKQIKVDRPCLLSLSKERLWISDPMHRGGAIKIILNNYATELQLPSDGTTLKVSYKKH